MNREPFVRVVATIDNQPPRIAAAIESVFSQTDRHHAVIVVDAGSTDTASQGLKGVWF